MSEESSLNFKKIPWRIHLTILSIGAAIVALMSYGFYLGNHSAAKYTPLIDATMEIKLEATIAHLWFEEIISNHRFDDLQSVKDHLDQAQWYANAMLKGGENTEGRFIAVSDPVLIKEINLVKKKLNYFRQSVDKRYEVTKQSKDATLISRQFDTVFDNFIEHVDLVETRLQNEIVNNTKLLKVIQVILTILSVIFIGVIILVFHSFERRRASDLELIKVTNDYLEKALEEVKTLQGIIPICSYCNNIRDEKGLWNQLESYIHNHSDAEFSHSICPECYEKEMEKLRKEKENKKPA